MISPTKISDSSKANWNKNLGGFRTTDFRYQGGRAEGGNGGSFEYPPKMITNYIYLETIRPGT